MVLLAAGVAEAWRSKRRCFMHVSVPQVDEGRKTWPEPWRWRDPMCRAAFGTG